jgi:carbon storage regulator CsrA
MLVLSRRVNERILFPSLGISIQLVATRPGQARLGIDAPPDVPVLREEVFVSGADFQAQVAAADRAAQLSHLINNRLSASAVGLALLRRQLELGRAEDMSGTLDKLDRELELLKRQVAEAAGPRPAPESRRPRALLVEDDLNECELLAGFLRLAGIDVETAGDGADALDHLSSRGRPDVLLLDMILPRCDGPSTVRTIRRNPAYEGLKIYGLTGARGKDFGLSEGPAGIDHWFHKPLNPQELLQYLHHELHTVS